MLLCWIFSPHQPIPQFRWRKSNKKKRKLTYHRVNQLRPQDTEDNPYYYTFKVQCTSCREVHPNWISFTRFVRSHCRFNSLDKTTNNSSGTTWNSREPRRGQFCVEVQDLPGTSPHPPFVLRVWLRNKADKPENKLCLRDSRPEYIRSGREAQRAESARFRLSGVGAYRVQAGCTFPLTYAFFPHGYTVTLGYVRLQWIRANGKLKGPSRRRRLRGLICWRGSGMIMMRRRGMRFRLRR